jgi:hypothetical protein
MSAALVAGLWLVAGCTQFDPAGVRARMESLVAQNKFQEARALPVKGYPPGTPKKSPEEVVKEELIESLVNPAEAKFTAARIRSMETQVTQALGRGEDEAARQAVYECGITEQRAVDKVTFLAKCAYLNSRVNPATLAKWKRVATEEVPGYIQSGDFAKATAAAKRIPTVAAYPKRIDDWMDQSGEEAVVQRAREEGVGKLEQAQKKWLYGKIAPRAGFRKGLNPLCDDLVARLAELHGLEVPYGGFEPGFEPDWTEVEARLEQLRLSLLQDDVEEEDADFLVETLLQGFQSLVPKDRNGLTTLELNERLQALRTGALKAIQKALSEERARVAAEMAEKASAELAAQNKALEKTWLDVLAQLASAVDFLARERGFTAAISDRVEPDINRILGEGARALRLYRANGKMTKGQATSLLLAGLYMGFDDVENFAMGCGADIDGTSEKDTLKRTPYLLALQFGFKGQAEKLLDGADPTLRDAKGFGAVHYAVRGNDAVRLMRMLEEHFDARRAAVDGTTPLMLAAALDNGTMTRMLLGVSDIDATNQDGYAAIHFAAENGNLDIVRTLATEGAALDKATTGGADLLELAATANAEDVIGYLVDDWKMKVKDGPVSWCVAHAKVLPLKTLVAHGGKLKDAHLALAARCGHLDMVEYLVGQGCDVNSPEVHEIVPMLVLPTSPETAKAIAAYLYSQGYRE